MMRIAPLLIGGKKGGLDKHSFFLTDPVAIDAESSNFNLTENSVLLDYGFTAWNYNKAGICSKGSL